MTISKKIDEGNLKSTIAITDIIFKLNYWIVEAEADGDNDRFSRLVDSMERQLLPIVKAMRDKEYPALLAYLETQKPKKHSTQDANDVAWSKYRLMCAEAKHTGLLDLCQRAGFYPVLKLNCFNSTNSTEYAGVEK